MYQCKMYKCPYEEDTKEEVKLMQGSYKCCTSCSELNTCKLHCDKAMWIMTTKEPSDPVRCCGFCKKG